MPSAKLDDLMERLDGIVAERHRTLIFSQFTRLLGRARDLIEAAGIDYCCYPDGKTRDRAQVLSRFKDGTAPVFLNSVKAGGAGLTLTRGGLRHPAGPLVEPCHRSPGRRPRPPHRAARKVMAYRMIANNTIEEKVMALKERKAPLAASLLPGDDFAAAGLTVDDIRGLLT